ncbi:hypothetical protein CAEBREN_01476 [Caenorhabditis brenneri]|uniref:Uncharacterized protein n=1 Tax=Caenorhabditis brenneri TaxID=135651 RepID=G0NKD5_CAEBE|nr:hypothetical protein CAEBREN_01476 [Caenorhabditis brenneri]
MFHKNQSLNVVFMTEMSCDPDTAPFKKFHLLYGKLSADVNMCDLDWPDPDMKAVEKLFLGTTVHGYWLNPKVANEPTRQTTMTPDFARESNCKNYLKIMITIVCEDRCKKRTYEKLLVKGCKSKFEAVFIKEVCCPSTSLFSYFYLL